MVADPYTLVVALDEDGMAEGKLYLDDGESYDYRKTDGAGKTTQRFSFSGGVLSGRGIEGSGGYKVPNM